MRVLLSSLAVLVLAGCTPSKRLVLPNTAETQACKRECMAMASQCFATARGWGPVGKCEDIEEQCPETCPGARWEYPNPNRD